MNDSRTRSDREFLYRAAGLGLLLLAGGTAGCQKEPSRYAVSGTVTYEGRPVPYGLIYFDPDSSRNNSGPQGAGEIRDGTFRTFSGTGIVGGPHVVRVMAWDGPPEQSAAVLLADNYKEPADFPKRDTEYHIVLPPVKP